MKDLTPLFLFQSYKDAWDDYCRALENPRFPHWDAIVLTASSERQAEGYRNRLARLRFPAGIYLAVIPDKDGKRVGSGGATLSVIRHLKEKFGSFENKRFLVIHSGGDSKRVPSNSAIGKLFSPVPHVLPDGRLSTLFDELMISAGSIPGRMSEGMLLLSGDVILLFNSLQIDNFSRGAAAISFKENVSTGKDHGVFLADEEGCIKRFLHKQSEETLRDLGAVNDRGNVDIDTGAILFGTDLLNSLYGLVSNDELSDKFINEKTRLSLYGDFLYPLASDSTLEQFYDEKPEGVFCDELRKARTEVWNALRRYRMTLYRLSPAKFIHFGTTGEILDFMNGKVDGYSLLGWSGKSGSIVRGNLSGYNSVLGVKASAGDGCYLECSHVHGDARLGNNCLVSFLELKTGIFPDDVVLHGLKLGNGKFVCRIYGVRDNPKEDLLFGRKLDDFVKENGLSPSDVWRDGEEHTLWNASLYPECGTMSEAAESAARLYELVHDCKGDLQIWLSADRTSLRYGAANADLTAAVDWSERMEELVKLEKLADLVTERAPVEQVDTLNITHADAPTKIRRAWLENKLKALDPFNADDFSYIIRLYYYLGHALPGNGYRTKCFSTISDTIRRASVSQLRYNENAKIHKDDVTVKLPLRVNFGGGWSDTAPYCVENGGAVLNAAIFLNGELPVTARVTRTDEKKIVFESRDMNTHGEFTDISKLRETGDPFDPFALQKACLLACGVIPASGGDLGEILDRLGGGFVLRSEVAGVPKGSGLGTSSILSAACLKAMFEFTGTACSNERLYSSVMVMEQIMSTGGGWQDQVGGLSDGVKFITSEPGLVQRINVEKISIPQAAAAELNDRFCLIYTGQRRLARNILRSVVGRYLGENCDSIYAHKEIKHIASLMKSALESGDVTGFANLLDRQWELSRMIDPSSTNTLIDQIFLSIEDLIDGRMVCGAGGGGFLQTILKNGVSKEEVHARLKSVFQDFPVDVWRSEFIY